MPAAPHLRAEDDHHVTAHDVQGSESSTTMSSDMTASAPTADRQGTSPTRVAAESRSWHLRATSDRQARYWADNHSQLHNPNELAVPRASRIKASREYA